MPAADGARLPRPVVPPRPLGELAGLLGVRTDPGASGPGLTGVTLDSRSVVAGDLYAALPGSRAHGAEFCAQAAAGGAVAVLTDDDGRARAVAAGLPVLVVRDPRAVLGEVAAWVYGHPGERLLLLGVTGTNGKTTTAYLVEAGLRAAGHRTGLLGTVQTRVGDEVMDSARTTPEAPDVQALLALMVERGCTAAVMEVSSHALSLGRVDGLVFDVAVFTNLSQDHLDFHAHDRGVLRGQGFPVHRAAHPRGARRRRRRVRATARGAVPGPGDDLLEPRRRVGGLACAGRADRSGRLGVHRPRSFRGARIRGAAAAGRVQRRERSVRSGRAGAGRSAAAGRGRGGGRARGRARADGTGARRAAVPRARRLRAHAGRGSHAAGRGPPTGPGPRAAGARVRRRPRPLQAPVDGGGRGPRRGPGGAHRRTTRARRTRTRSSPLWLPARTKSPGHGPPTVSWSSPTGPRRSAAPFGPRGPATRSWSPGKGHETGQEVAGVVRPFDDRVELRRAIERTAVAS